MPDFEECLATFQTFCSDVESSSTRNEATTRLQLIDKIFFDCLGWSRNDVITEESHAGEYADYTFLAPRRVLIVEAKREGEYFELPAGNSSIEQSLVTLSKHYPRLKAALEQVSGYCQKRGVAIGSVCNGHQIVVFVATRLDGAPPLEGRALVFESLKQMEENFLELWQAISKPGIEDGHLGRRLLGTRRPSIPNKLSTQILHYPGVRNRNILQSDLQIVSELVIEDLARNHELEDVFLDECYCRSGALSQYALISKDILESRYAALFDSTAPGPSISPATTKKGVNADLLAESLSRRPLLLIGDVGVGKSIFIRNLIKREAQEEFGKAITLFIDLGSQGTLTGELRAFVLDEMERQLLDQYATDILDDSFVRGVYHGDLRRFERGVEGRLKDLNPLLFEQKQIEFLLGKIENKPTHLQECLRHLSKARRQQIIVVIDNADQRDDETQQQAFLIAQEFAEHWPVTVFVSLRPETFHRSVQYGALSGYHPRAFTISPPRIDEVIDRRLSFAKKLTSGEIPIELLSHQRTEIRLQRLEKVIDIFLLSLRRNRDLVEFIDNMSGGNVRSALDQVKGFFGSGHVDTSKILELYERRGGYTIPLHEFVRAVIYGDGEYYDAERSPIANIFDVSSPDIKEHFLLPVALTLAMSLGTTAGEEGFVHTDLLYERLQGLGFTPEQIDAAIVRGHRKRLFEMSARRVPVPGLEMPQSLRVTTVGAYHVRKLCGTFVYADAVVVDTPITDSDTRQLIRNVATIRDRLTRADYFKQYLDSSWTQMLDNVAVFDWNANSENLKGEIQRISAGLSHQQ